jgi:hypothetical protein
VVLLVMQGSFKLESGRAVFLFSFYHLPPLLHETFAQPLTVFIFDATGFHKKTSLFKDNILILLDI